jgi:hypothetical protein
MMFLVFLMGSDQWTLIYFVALWPSVVRLLPVLSLDNPVAEN